MWGRSRWQPNLLKETDSGWRKRRRREWKEERKEKKGRSEREGEKTEKTKIPRETGLTIVEKGPKGKEPTRERKNPNAEKAVARDATPQGIGTTTTSKRRGL